ncbi:MAG: type II secretion system protein [Bacilli bacterium]|nr:type II secretion system protein [Bacilli bacterium]
MKKKGFTLIELLAVIVILGIITVIAVPKVLDIINKSRESASNSSIKLVKDAIKTQVASSDLTGPVFTKETDGCYLFNFDDQTSGNAKALEIKNKDKVSGSIKYCNNTFSDDTLKFDGNSISKGDTKRPICKRATTLHTEECTQTDTTYYCSGAGYTENGSKRTSTITYGNLGNKGILTSGDAFDCDVNGDEVYDSETERFYYVSDYYNTSTKSFENDTAVLIYYNNVSAGNSNNSNLYAYDSSGENFHGPRTAISQLPTTKQWSNVSLKNEKRAILNEKETYSNDFSYTECSSRVLTTQEVNKSCNITTGSFNYGELDSCNFLIENTNYSSDNIKNTGFWLESPYSGDSVNVWYITSKQRVQSYRGSADDTGIGVRPVIEVSKINIDY